MDTTSDLVLALNTLRGHVRTTDRLELFVLNTEEFVLRDEGEVFHFVIFFIHRRSLRPLPSITFIGFFKTTRVNVTMLRMKFRTVIVMMSPHTLCV